MLHNDWSTETTELTPRQDRLESAIVVALQTRSTRSELRSAVTQLVDLFRLQHVPAETGVLRIRSIAVRASAALAQSDPAAGDAAAEQVGMVVRWATDRYWRRD